MAVQITRKWQTPVVMMPGVGPVYRPNHFQTTFTEGVETWLVANGYAELIEPKKVGAVDEGVDEGVEDVVEPPKKAEKKTSTGLPDQIIAADNVTTETAKEVAGFGSKGRRKIPIKEAEP